MGFIQPVPTYLHRVQIWSPAHPIKKTRYRKLGEGLLFYCNWFWSQHLFYSRILDCHLPGKQNKNKNHVGTNPHPFFPPKLHELGIFSDHHLQSHRNDLWLVRNPILCQQPQRRLVCPLSWDLTRMNTSQRQGLALLCLKPRQSMLWNTRLHAWWSLLWAQTPECIGTRGPFKTPAWNFITGILQVISHGSHHPNDCTVHALQGWLSERLPNQGCEQHLSNSAVVTDLLKDKRCYFSWNRVCAPGDTSASSLRGSHDWNKKIPLNKASTGYNGETQMCSLSQGLDEPLVFLTLLCKFCGPFYCYRENK